MSIKIQATMTLNRDYLFKFSAEEEIKDIDIDGEESEDDNEEKPKSGQDIEEIVASCVKDFSKYSKLNFLIDTDGNFGQNSNERNKSRNQPAKGDKTKKRKASKRKLTRAKRAKVIKKLIKKMSHVL